MGGRKGQIAWNKGIPNSGFKQGYTPYNKGQPHSEEEKLKISEALKNYYLTHDHPMSDETRKKLSLAAMGQQRALGHKVSEEARKRMSQNMKGRKVWNKDKPFLSIRGSNHWNWKGGVKKQELGGFGLDWKLWRRQVYERDKYTCQDCGKSGVYIEPHHIIPKRINKERMFDVTNGITLCRPCHILTMGKEELFAERYSASIVV